MLLHDGAGANGQEPRKANWLSCGLETLIDERSRTDRPTTAKGEHDFDIVIVGSGYGGAIAAAELSGCTDQSGRSPRICVLERGREYLPGAFPGRQADLAGHVRFATPKASRQGGAHDGLYDIRWSDDAVVVVASGLGGGSLINAGVTEMPHPTVFQEARWPKAIREARDLKRLATRLLPLLGANRLPGKRADELNKTRQLRKLANHYKAALTRITVAGAARSNSAAVKINKCLMCGDCAVGCNHGAKDSLDSNLLVSAARKGARIVTGATVIRVSVNDNGTGGWMVHVNHTDEHLRDRQPHPFVIRAKRVILAAGTLGSTEILLRSQGELRFSAQLGRKFSANGDMLVTAYDVTEPVNAVADEARPIHAPPKLDAEAIGPTITGMIDLRDGNPKTDLVIEDLAVPGPLRRLFAEATTTFRVLNQLADPDFKSHEAGWPKKDTAAVDQRAIKHSLVLAMIGRDDAEGELTLGDRPVRDNADGLLTVRWPALRTDPRLQQHHARLAKLMEQSKLGGTVVNNLMWRPFSDALERLFEAQRGPLVTVHPLGGCAMGDDVRQGVTDDCGRVFDANGPSRQSVHEGLVVLDGSIVPTSLGINPSLTISVLALRAIMQLKAQWKLRDIRLGLPLGELERPICATTDIIRNPAPTRIELTEQVRGHVRLRTPTGAYKPHRVQITLTTEPTALDTLFACEADGQRSLSIAPGKGTLTILKAGRDFDAVSDQARREDIALEASISGQLRLFEFAQSNWFFRTARALWAWVGNRGLRDLVQDRLQWFQEFLHLRPRPEQLEPTPSRGSRMWQFVSGIVSVCSRAGAVRLITYDLTVGTVIYSPGFDASRFKDQTIRAVKRLTYYRAASPFTQLLQMTVEHFPEMRPPVIRKLPLLELNKRYLARQQIPLVRVVNQQDGIAALSDMLSFVLYAFRVVLQIHALSFRRPDAPLARIPQRLPETAPGLPEPQIEWLTVDEKIEPPVRIRLTRYDGSARQPVGGAVTRPVLLIHGYSASGTTFAHPAVTGNLAHTLCKSGRDVWVLDMRCSAGLPTAASDWPFEMMAAQDIPIAIEHVSAARTNGHSQPSRVDVVAHCMGAAMFSMAMLADGPRHERLRHKIGRVVFSQVGPVMILSRTNVLAAYIMRYARPFVSMHEYTFSPQGESTLVGQLYDRVLTAMSMPRHEFKRENPFLPPRATPWAGTRHRMDALYGRTFSLKNLSTTVLDRLDDFFGPISIETVSQVIHFAGYNTVTDKRGVNRYVTPQRIAERLTFPMMSIHGDKNGLVDVATLALMRNTLEVASVPYLNAIRGYGTGDPTAMSQSPDQIEKLIADSATSLAPGQGSYLTWRIEGYGHQDCLIGKRAGRNCGVIAKYLCAPDPPAGAACSAAPQAGRSRISTFQAAAPAYGVRIRVLKYPGKIRILASDSPGRGRPRCALVVPVAQDGDRLVPLHLGGSRAMPTDINGLRSLGVCIGKPVRLRKRRRRRLGPYFFDVPFSDWPRHAPEVLVLLLYNQADGIGGNPRPPDRIVQSKSRLTNAVSEALTYDTISDLRGGLIRGSTSDLTSFDDVATPPRVTFALGSCLYPNDILNHMPAAESATWGVADATLLRLGQRLGEAAPPTLLLLAGDQIYADATAGLFDPRLKNSLYRMSQERRGESPGARAVLQRLDLDVRMMLDDHEIRDNWAPNDPHAATLLRRGRAAYWLYERASPEALPALWHKVMHKGLPFFLADARTQREPRTAADWRNKAIMHPAQFRKLCKWLAVPRFAKSPKFVMTASALLPRRLTVSQEPAIALASDAWEGYPLSLHSLLRFICDHQIEGVVFLSGDEHISSVTEARVTCLGTGNSCTLHSIHSSGLFSPYPFANGSPGDFVAKDAFGFKHSDGVNPLQEYRCEVTTEFYPGDGFALVTARSTSPRWFLDVEFSRSEGSTSHPSMRLI
ncbi:alpha/beta fold hydrolase [Bradyrhizobium sp. CCGUVB14]|uniref:alpha/beta fold hydrolase n=1 Tax=Bradyrhizobium sp. CCGUVB14 TaxID=2949628 RepID=UPI0020B39BD6|nr:GMC family oxidoreductase N-terminal domain-containing protein [Bradyrhizobium sp. CCGUVB14]MCP3446154.1 alpha/beta fold hydrolase [Bradyrhizobium sp. CCGUVB14]